MVLILSKTSHKVQLQSGFRRKRKRLRVENDANAKVDADVLIRL